MCACGGSLLVGWFAAHRWPFPETDPILGLIQAHQPWLFAAFKYAYIGMLFTTPFFTLALLGSLAFIFIPTSRGNNLTIEMPSYPEPTRREDLFVIAGEVHHPRRNEPVEHPTWLTIPRRGLFTGIFVIGAVGSSKTSGCMIPFAEQILHYRPLDSVRRIGGLVLEVKGDFCKKIREILRSAGRESDYLEISLDGPYRYNPLYNDLDAYAQAYSIATLINNLYGRSKEPFWQQAYTNLVKFLILLHQILYDYVTLFDIYECAINPDLVEQRIREASIIFERRSLLISIDDFVGNEALESLPFERDTESDRMRAIYTEELEARLRELSIPFEIEIEAGGPEANDDIKRQQFEAVRRWFFQDWKRIEPRLRTSIVEGISVFLSLFDDNPAVKRVFCPPKETYDPVANADGRYGKPLPPFAELIEQGQVCALNFPMSANPALARTMGTFMKQDFQRAMLNRIPRMEREPERHWREVLFLCDEYHAFATVGESDPSGDEKFFALSRQAKCISIVATQSLSSLRSALPGESWRTLFQTFRTKIFLTLSDDFSAKTASELCGKVEQLKPSYTLSESGHDAGVSVLTGQAIAHKTNLGTSKGYHLQRDFLFESKVFGELQNAQAIVLAYDGLNPHPPTYCYLKPYYLDRNRSYFDQIARGELCAGTSLGRSWNRSIHC